MKIKGPANAVWCGEMPLESKVTAILFETGHPASSLIYQGSVRDYDTYAVAVYTQFCKTVV